MCVCYVCERQEEEEKDGSGGGTRGVDGRERTEGGAFARPMVNIIPRAFTYWPACYTPVTRTQQQRRSASNSSLHTHDMYYICTVYIYECTLHSVTYSFFFFRLDCFFFCALQFPT